MSKKIKPLSEKDLSALAKLHAAALTPQLLDTAAAQARMSSVTLEVFGIGYSSEFGRYTFPMVDGAGKLTGFALWGGQRDGAWNERAGAVPGSRLGLFLPTPYEVPDCPLIDAPQLLILPQGPIDAAFCRDVGFMGAVGRPACAACAGDVATLLAGHPPQEVIVVMPGGEGAPGYVAGATGAMDLIELLAPMVPEKVASVRLLCPPTGQTFRQAVRNFDDLAAAIVAAKWMTPTVIEAGKRKLAKLEGRKVAA